jgi:hypothetical protein
MPGRHTGVRAARESDLRLRFSLLVVAAAGVPSLFTVNAAGHDLAGVDADASVHAEPGEGVGRSAVRSSSSSVATAAVSRAAASCPDDSVASSRQA